MDKVIYVDGLEAHLRSAMAGVSGDAYDAYDNVLEQINELAKPCPLERVEEMEFLQSLLLEFEVCRCDCGQEWKDTDAHDLVRRRIAEIEAQSKENLVEPS